jgi:hypothetical protein
MGACASRFAAYGYRMSESQKIDASLLDDAMQRADREMDDVGLVDLQRQMSVFETTSSGRRPYRWALRERASLVWDENGARRLTP